MFLSWIFYYMYLFSQVLVNNIIIIQIGYWLWIIKDKWLFLDIKGRVIKLSRENLFCVEIIILYLWRWPLSPLKQTLIHTFCKFWLKFAPWCRGWQYKKFITKTIGTTDNDKLKSEISTEMNEKCYFLNLLNLVSVLLVHFNHDLLIF